MSGGVEVSLPHGDCTAVRGPGVDIVLSTARQQTVALECCTEFGIDPGSRPALIVKSLIECKPAFEAVGREILYVDVDISKSGDQGLLLQSWPYRSIVRPKWLFDNITEP